MKINMEYSKKEDLKITIKMWKARLEIYKQSGRQQEVIDLKNKIDRFRKQHGLQ